MLHVPHGIHTLPKIFILKGRQLSSTNNNFKRAVFQYRLITLNQIDEWWVHNHKTATNPTFLTDGLSLKPTTCDLYCNLKFPKSWMGMNYGRSNQFIVTLLKLFKFLNDNKKWLEVVVAITGGKLKECPYYIHFNFIISLRTQSYLKGHLSNPINK